MKPERSFEQTGPRSRKPSASDESTATTNRQKTFFLTRDPNQNSSPNRPKPTQTSEAPGALPGKDVLEHNLRQISTAQFGSSGSRRRSTIKPARSDSQGTGTVSEHAGIQQSSLDVLQVGSAATSPTSMSSQPSVEESPTDETASQAVVSSDDEGEQNLEASFDDSAPQLIMPSIRMPSRRPFTQHGRQLGKLKILVTGNRGSGRTSLIKSIVQLCEHIVHVDTMPNNGTLNTENHRSINEIYASTKPYPEWWSDIDDSRILRRRKSLGNSVLERNICFVDVTGAGKVEDTLTYIEQQLLVSIGSISQPGSELNNLLSGRGGCQVDLVLYLVTKENLKLDLAQIRRISHVANVVPLIAKADSLSPDQLAILRSAVSMSDCSLPRLPVLGEASGDSQVSAPYRVSSANGPDVDNMDASLLMSPEYVQPLLPSDLAMLVEQIFNPSVLEYLRYLSGKKLVAWYATNPKFTRQSSPSVRSGQLSNPDSPGPTSLSHSGLLNPATSEVSLNTSNSFALAKVADHTLREEHLAQLRLCRWASELQLSLQRERERYESVAQSERALWLVQKMGEEIRDGQIVPVQPHSSTDRMVMDGKRSAIHYTTGTRYEVYDPLGLIRWQDIVRARGWVMLQVIGSFGVVGGVAIWLAKTMGWTSSLHQWVQSWYGNE